MKIIIQEGLLPGRDLKEKFKAAGELGLDGVELTIFGPPLLKDRLSEIKDAMDASGTMPRVLCGGYRGWLGHFEEEQRETAIRDIMDSMALCGQIGVKGLIAPAAFGMHSNALPPFSAPRTQKEDDQVLVDGLRRIRDAAEKHQVTMLLEPLNRYEDHMVNTVEKAVSIVDKVDSPFVKVMGDLYHMNIEEADMVHTLGRYADYVKHIHLADSNRLQPGKGHIDFTRILSTLKQSGFDGYMGFECTFAGDDRMQAIQESMNFLRK